MKKLLYFLLIGAFTTAFGQQNSKNPMVLTNGIVASSGFIKTIEKEQNVKSVNVYKSKDNLPENLKSYADFAQNGLINIELKENYYDKIKLASLNGSYDLPAENPIYFDGFVLNDPKMVILGNVLEQIDLKKINGKDVLVISSTPKENSVK